MNELANTQTTGLTPIHVLAEEARIYSESMAMNMLNLGRIFTEAKKQVPHGEWGEWVQRNSGMSVRSAQQLMAIYARFGDKPAFAGVEKSKMYKMLALPEGTEDAFMANNDVSAMSSREVEEAVKRVREQANKEIAQEREARKAAEARVQELADRPPEVPVDVIEELNGKDRELERYRLELERVGATQRELLEQRNDANRKLLEAQRELRESAELLDETQQECNRAQAELLNLQSTIAKGDAERAPTDQLTVDVFASAVRQFIGVCARMPHMARTFAIMPLSERNAYDELLRTVEGWVAGSRAAMNTIAFEEVEIHGEE